MKFIEIRDRVVHAITVAVFTILAMYTQGPVHWDNPLTYASLAGGMIFGWRNSTDSYLRWFKAMFGKSPV